MEEPEPEAIAGWNPFAQLMAFAVAFIGMALLPWMTRLLDHTTLTPYERDHPMPDIFWSVLLVAGFAHLTGGLIVLRALARVPNARWWGYAIGGIVAAYLTFIFGMAVLSLDPEAGPPAVCWPCLFAPRNVLLFWPIALCWGLTYWLFADLDVSKRRITRAK